MNIDFLNDVPNPATLKGYPYARFVYNVSRGTGNTNLSAVAQQINTWIDGFDGTPIIVVNHQTWGEGQGYNWHDMNWPEFTNRWSAFLVKVHASLGSRNVIIQVFNEHDTSGAASIFVPPHAYALLFNAARAAMPGRKMMTGGYVTGAGSGMAHFKASNIRPDYVAFHPYGASAGGLYQYPGIPSVDAQIAEWRKLGLPLFITEFGVLNRKGDPASLVRNYARNFMASARGKVLGALWYGWSHNMHNGYGVLRNGVVDNELLNVLKPTTGAPVDAPTEPDVYAETEPAVKYYSGGTRNVRDMPTIRGRIIGQIKTNERFTVLPDVVFADGYRWRKIHNDGQQGWVAVDGGSLYPMAVML